MVDDRQRVWLNGAPEKGTVEVNWAGESCRATYQITSFSDTTHYVTAPCH
ncbi:FimD/PapC C-terminal domain-containing protein [Enterobacter sp.]|nr:FimD/PapC C-terminal domain-containing protein [Enterobacter sp.]MDU1923963.1 FimD/PapC C-terminal domain-containing protein [Enterobacter sp.]